MATGNVLVGQSGGPTAVINSSLAGPERVKAQAAGASAIEVGSYSAQFWKQLLSWVGRLE